MDMMKRVPVAEQAPEERARNFKRVCPGHMEEEAGAEASRCLNYKNSYCVAGCPVSINIPVFLQQVITGQEAKAAGIIAESSALPAVCDRVCPQETQCEGVRVHGTKDEPVAIGKLERYVADRIREHKLEPENHSGKNGQRVAVIGAGSAGLTCMGDLVKLGYEVKIFEALHKSGDVLVYGIPEFQLPKDTVVAHEVENVKKLGVEIKTNAIIGKSVLIGDLLDKEGYDAVFIGSGTGLPMFMHTPGETANSVFSVSEFLMHNNLIKALREDYDTPISAGKCAIVVDGGNVAMDAAQTALHLSMETCIVYRRSEAELLARVEEAHHAKGGGVISDLFTNPVEILQGENGWVRGVRVIHTEFGGPDQSDRRRPIEIPDSEEEIPAGTVIMTLDISPSPLFSSTTEGLEANRKGCLIVDEKNGQTTREGVFAGGDVIVGTVTATLVMGAGRQAAHDIDEYLRSKRA